MTYRNHIRELCMYCSATLIVFTIFDAANVKDSHVKILIHVFEENYNSELLVLERLIIKLNVLI